jgi:mannonate dehydratase
VNATKVELPAECCEVVTASSCLGHNLEYGIFKSLARFLRESGRLYSSSWEGCVSFPGRSGGVDLEVYNAAMRIALVVTQMTDENLRLAAQVGVTDIVGRYPGPKLAQMSRLCDRVARYGMRMSVLEGYIPHGDIVCGGPQRDYQIENVQHLLCNMAESGVEVCCYNFMPNEEWVRTSVEGTERGGAEVTAFELKQSLQGDTGSRVDSGQLWENLEYFLKQVLPVATEMQVKMAMHPDDPPLSSFRGHDQIMYSLENFQRLLRLVDVPANGVCFCQGCFAEMGEDVPAAIRQLGARIHYVHFRDVCGCAHKFCETFHDNGQTDMAEAMRAYHEIGFAGPMRPDHVPTLAGETTEAEIEVPEISDDLIDADTFNGADTPVSPGYAMRGRLFAVGYMRGLMDAITRQECHHGKNEGAD